MSRSEQVLTRFIPRQQLLTIAELAKGEEGQFFIDKMAELVRIIETMPNTGETDGQGMEAIAWLHYFYAGSDWWITEKDVEEEQYQAFGYACLNGDWEMAELGYIPIVELVQMGVEIDLYWEPKKLKEIVKRG